MKEMLKTMKNPKYGIPIEILPVFEEIAENYPRQEVESEFAKAMEQHLSREQRFRIFEQNGSCKGTKYDKDRKAFALEHEDKPLSERLEIYSKMNGVTAVLNSGNTITIPFSCRHGYYKHAPKGKFTFKGSLETYFERCAGGRLYEYQKALGINLKIKSVDVSPLEKNVSNPVIFKFEIVE